VIAGGPPAERLGSAPDAKRLRRLAKSLGVADRVILLGAVPRAGLPALLRSAHIMVCAPEYEPFGIVALEAMACAVPVVASAGVGALSDVVVDAVTGLHVPPGRPDTLAATIRSLLANPTDLQALGLAGYDRVRARYSWHRIAADALRIYESVTHRVLADDVPAVSADLVG
jgi:glycosyltransferase involved in cell wall biosynthesis